MVLPAIPGNGEYWTCSKTRLDLCQALVSLQVLQKHEFPTKPAFFVVFKQRSLGN
jgi:hypothetical protein